MAHHPLTIIPPQTAYFWLGGAFGVSNDENDGRDGMIVELSGLTNAPPQE